MLLVWILSGICFFSFIFGIFAIVYLVDVERCWMMLGN